MSRHPVAVATDALLADNAMSLAFALRRLEKVIELLSGVTLASPDPRQLAQAHAFAVAARRSLRAAINDSPPSHP